MAFQVEPAEEQVANHAAAAVPSNGAPSAERQRLTNQRERGEPWWRWGPYLSERQWGTVREDYSAYGSAWDSFPHDHARSRAYRWGEDGLLGISDNHGRLCFSIGLWNEQDAILKERLFGLTGPEGNHGEDVKEYYFYLDSTPTHSYMRGLYKYPQRAFPYAELVAENRRRGKDQPEYELVDTGAFAEDRYFDVEVEYAKASPTDLVIRISATNRGPDAAPLHILPTLWFRNTWMPSRTRYFKNGINDAVVNGHTDAVNPEHHGTKAAAHYVLHLQPREAHSVVLRLSADPLAPPLADAEQVLRLRQAEADVFYATQFGQERMTHDERRIQRQAFAGMLWSKQFYYYEVEEWLVGDPAGPPPPEGHKHGRNGEWRHLHNADVISMPDKWEYPWYAAWDLAFHCIPLAQVDPDFAKRQLVLMLREWYMHPNGQIPAYEWAFGDVNPPVHAWAAWRVYKIDRRINGVADRRFLERVFQKLLLNFTWWVNRKDADGHNVFQGGFLGLNNIGVFDRSAPLPTGGHLGQADGTAWMGMYCLNVLSIALELAREDPVYEDLASKFFEHFLYIAEALNNLGGMGIPLWNDEDEFFYDALHLPDGQVFPLKVRSLVGLIPLLAVETIEPDLLDRLPGFKSPYGIRAISRYHLEHPYRIELDGSVHEVRYEPGESSTGLFGGNSNWRGPIWFPINFLIVEALQKFQNDPHWRDNLPFHEYFHGDNGRGVGASHQTGWTGVIAKLLEQTATQMHSPRARTQPGPRRAG